ncbi:MAG: hypothetical protein MJZ34_12830 [Paludibacteraceae bacterium]|nr:hypothetical protein [Paludibacteraceae bacterium]
MIQLKSKDLVAKCVSQNNKDLQLNQLIYPNIRIPNRGLAYTLSFKDENDEMIVKLKKDIAEYNAYIEKLFAIEGFWELFKKNGYCISRNECLNRFGTNSTEIIFSLKRYQFQTEICVNDEWAFLREAKWKYTVMVEDTMIEFETEETDEGYPKTAKIGNRNYDILWNWCEDERDFCFYFWNKADSKAWIEVLEDDEEPVKDYSSFTVYDQSRDCMDGPDINLMKVFKLLQDMGYLSVYYINSETENPIWKFRSAPNGKIGMMLLDTSFEKNSMAMEKIKLLLNCAESDVNDFILTDENGHQVLSKDKGLYGGHCKLKIYGKMDCASANRYVDNGQYVQHRVFFKDEETAIKAGYRPCAKCMPEAYKEWKEKQK